MEIKKKNQEASGDNLIAPIHSNTELSSAAQHNRKAATKRENETLLRSHFSVVISISLVVISWIGNAAINIITDIMPEHLKRFIGLSMPILAFIFLINIIFVVWKDLHDQTSHSISKTIESEHEQTTSEKEQVKNSSYELSIMITNLWQDYKRTVYGIVVLGSIGFVSGLIWGVYSTASTLSPDSFLSTARRSVVIIFIMITISIATCLGASTLFRIRGKKIGGFICFFITLIIFGIFMIILRAFDEYDGRIIIYIIYDALFVSIILMTCGFLVDLLRRPFRKWIFQIFD